jgi:hypothetical protein
LFNVDEIGLTVVQHEVRKMLAMEGKKQVACLPSAQRGTHYCCDIHECFVYLRAPFDGLPPPKHQGCYWTVLLQKQLALYLSLVGFKYTASQTGSLKAPLAL